VAAKHGEEKGVLAAEFMLLLLPVIRGSVWGRMQTDPATGGEFTGQGRHGAQCGMKSLSGMHPGLLPRGSTVI
jgi:hypothetical protein